MTKAEKELKRIEDLKLQAAKTVLRNYHNSGFYDYDGLSPENIAVFISRNFTAGMTWKNFGNMPGRWNIDYRTKNLTPIWWTQALYTVFRGPGEYPHNGKRFW